MSSEPTLGEVVRRLDDIAKRLENFATLYVLRETYEAYRVAHDREFRDIRGDISELWEARKADQAQRRQMSLTLAVAVIGWLVTVAITIVNIASR